MKHLFAVALAASIGFGLVTTGSALAYAPPNQPIKNYSRIATLPPLAYQIFCLKNPGECRTSTQGMVHNTTALMNKVAKVNLAVNRSMIAKADGAADVWTVGANAGDCEDFALNKRHQLIAMGVPAGALRMAVVKTSGGQGHAVLIVHTDGGDYVLDNLTNAIKPLGKSGLKLVAMSTANPDKWKNS